MKLTNIGIQFMQKFDAKHTRQHHNQLK